MKCREYGCFNEAIRDGYCLAHQKKPIVLRKAGRPYPRRPEPHLGVEIEVEFPDEATRRMALCHYPGYYDKSLGRWGMEIKMCGLPTVLTRRAMRCVHTLWTLGAMIGPTCGLHVHLDRRHMSSTQVEGLLAWCAATEAYWFHLVTPSVARAEYVCPLGTAVKNPRYHWVNVTPFSTVEIRLHPATLNPYYLAGWLAAMAHLHQRVLQGDLPEVPPTFDRFLDFWSAAPVCVYEYFRYGRGPDDASFYGRSWAVTF